MVAVAVEWHLCTDTCTAMEEPAPHPIASATASRALQSLQQLTDWRDTYAPDTRVVPVEQLLALRPEKDSTVFKKKLVAHLLSWTPKLIVDCNYARGLLEKAIAQCTLPCDQRTHFMMLGMWDLSEADEDDLVHIYGYLLWSYPTAASHIPGLVGSTFVSLDLYAARKSPQGYMVDVKGDMHAFDWCAFRPGNRKCTLDGDRRFPTEHVYALEYHATGVGDLMMCTWLLRQALLGIDYAVLEVAVEKNSETLEDSVSQTKVYDRYLDYGFTEMPILGTDWQVYKTATAESGEHILPCMLCPLQTVPPQEWVRVLVDPSRSAKVFATTEAHLGSLPLFMQSDAFFRPDVMRNRGAQQSRNAEYANGRAAAAASAPTSRLQNRIGTNVQDTSNCGTGS
jgi:hypothetical protein